MMTTPEGPARHGAWIGPSGHSLRWILRIGLLTVGLSFLPLSLADNAGRDPIEFDPNRTISRAEQLIDAGQLQEAILYIEDALDQAVQFDPTDRARLHIRLVYAYGRLGAFDRVPAHIQMAEDLVADRQDPEAFSVYVDSLSARTMYFSGTRQLKKFRDASLAELAARRQLPVEASKLDVALINLGNANILLGDLEAAERYLLEALSFASRHQTNPRRITTIQVNLGVVYNQRKEHAIALRYWRQAIDAKREQAPESLSLANVLTNSASALRALGLLEEAELALSEALAIQREQLPASIDLGRTLYAMGQIAEARGNPSQAEDLYRETLEIMDASIPDAPGAAFSRRALAGLMIDQSRYDEARVLLDQAVALTGLTNNPGQHASTLFQIGRLAHARGDLDGARAHWYEAIEALETQYDQLGGSSLTLASFSQAYEPLYRKLSQLLIDSGEFIDAIRLLESYRNRALLERIDIDRILRRSEVGQALISDLSELRRQARSLVDTTSDSEGTESDPHERLAELRRQRLDRVAAAVQAQPGLDRLFEYRQQWEPTDLALEPGTRLLYYSLGEDRSDLLVVGTDGVRVHRLPPIAEISTLVERFRILVQRPDADLAPLEGVSRRLHEVLIAPAQGELEGVQSLMIRADGPLLLLPFSALRNHRDSYLVERFTLQRLHTLGDGHPGEARGAPMTQSYSGFAYAGGDESPSGRRAPRGRLRHVDEEIARAASQFGPAAEIYTGTAATESRARSIQGRRIVHFASHAVANPIEPLSSYISLSADEQHDGLFELWEVMSDLSLKGGLAVLSGCETALGPSFAGEGLFGLAKGFAYAGAESVIASLWAVDDASTLHLTQAFYRELAAGRSQAEALTLAQRAILSGEMPAASWWQRIFGSGPEHRYSHPYYWAAMTLTRTR
jgi:CHAT domain-containing protein/Tfp pilus assembly protein PilF